MWRERATAADVVGAINAILVTAVVYGRSKNAVNVAQTLIVHPDKTADLKLGNV